jgi:hypothetical protein
MASTISAGTTAGTSIAIAGDTSGQLQLQTNGTTAAVTIDTSQNVNIGTTTAIISGNKLSISGSSGAGVGVLGLVNSNSNTRKYSFGPDTNGNIVLYTDGGTGVYLLYNGTSWAGNSDERLKTDLKPIQNATEKVATLRTVTGRFKTDEKNVSRSFLIAQDIQKVFPEAVSNTPDGMLGVSYTDVIPLLVAAIKELNAKVEAQAVRIAELEGAK